VTYWAVDTVGNVEAVRTVKYFIDTTAPAITISGPVEGATYEVFPGFSVTTDDRLATVDWNIDGYPANMMPPMTAGTHTITATAVDVAGNVSVQRLTFKVKDSSPATAPIITVNGLVDGATYDSFPGYSVVVNDNKAVITMTIDGKTFTTVPALAAGTHVLKVVAVNTAGLTSEKTLIFTLLNASGSVANDKTVTVNTGDSKKVTLSSNAYLKSLKKSTGSLSKSFKQSRYSYKLTIAKGKKSVTLTPFMAQAKATLKIKVGSGAYKTVKSVKVALAKGKSKTVTIKVTAQDTKTTKTYTVKVVRKK
jgi:hypothetical protein